MNPHAFTPDRPHLIRQVLFHERDLRLHPEDDIPQRRGRPAIGRHAREHPCAALLIHQAARAVDGVDDDPPVDRRLIAPLGIAAAAARQPLGDEDEGVLAGEGFRESRDDRFPDDVDRVDRVAGIIAIDGRK